MTNKWVENPRGDQQMNREEFYKQHQTEAKVHELSGYNYNTYLVAAQMSKDMVVGIDLEETKERYKECLIHRLAEMDAFNNVISVSFDSNTGWEGDIFFIDIVMKIVSIKEETSK